MDFIKQFLLIAVMGCSALLWGSEEAAAKKVVEAAMKAGSLMDFSTAKQYYSNEYVKIAQDKKIFDRKLLENIATYFERIKDPDLTFSELVKLNFMLKGQHLTDAQLENYRRLDFSDRGKALVKQAQSQVKSQQDNVRQMANEAFCKYQYGSVYLEKNLAVLFYKLDFVFKIKGVLILRKENNQWKIYREFSTIDQTENIERADKEEVRKFALQSNRAARNFDSWLDLTQDTSSDCICIMPDGSHTDYQQSEKKAKFLDMVEKGNPTMVQAGPLHIEASGQKITPEMLANFANQDKSGQGKLWLQQYKNAIIKYRENLRNAPDDYIIKDIFVFEDCALLIDSSTLIETGRIERIALIKKYQGKYLIYRSVSCKVESTE